MLFVCAQEAYVNIDTAINRRRRGLKSTPDVFLIKLYNLFTTSLDRLAFGGYSLHHDLFSKLIEHSVKVVNACGFITFEKKAYVRFC